MKHPHFIAHHSSDLCAVAVVEDIKKNILYKIWNMETNELFDIKVFNDIPIGHKIALQDLKPDDTIIKYGVDIGKCILAVKKGEHLHTHNLKTKRW